jgi:restriction endonuclease S subunit
MSGVPSCAWIESNNLRPSRWNAEFYKSEFIALDKKIEDSSINTSRLKKLSKLFTGPFGSKLPASLYNTEGGIPLLRVQNIGELFLNENEMALIPIDVHQDIIRSKLEPGDIALAKAGRLGALSRIPERVKECNITQHIVGIKVNKNKIVPEYLTAYLMSKYGEFQLKRQAVGTIIKYLGIEETREAMIAIPDEKVQKYIGGFISCAEKCREKADTILLKAKELINELYGDSIPEKSEEKHNVISAEDLTTDRMDAWFYQLNFMNLKKYLLANRRFVPLAEIAKIRNRRTGSLKQEDCDQIDYVEISSIDVESSLIKPNRKKISDLPASAKKELHFGDVLASTVRVNRKCISVVPLHLNKSIGSTAIAVLKTPSIEEAHFLELILKHDISTSQIMRWNTGSVYPTVTEDVFEKILIPNICQDERKKIGRIGKLSASYRYKAVSLILKAKSDVEALIEGKLDTDAILSGKLKAPTWEDIEKELEGI